MKNKNNVENIECMLNKLTIDGFVSLDDTRLREDLMGLFADIRSQLRLNNPDKENLIYNYALLLQKELDLYCPYEAYEAGALLGCNANNGNGKAEYFMCYMKRIEHNPASKEIHSNVSVMYDELHKLLGDAYSLISEFTELYRKCNGIIQEKIDCFFDMGFAATYNENK